MANVLMAAEVVHSAVCLPCTDMGVEKHKDVSLHTGHTYIDHDYIGHNYIDHDYIGHNYTI